MTLVQSLPAAVPTEVVRRPVRLFAEAALADGLFQDARSLGSGFVGVDAASAKDDEAIETYLERFIREHGEGVRVSSGRLAGCYHPGPGRHPCPPHGRSRRQVQLPRAGRLHRPHSPHAEDPADGVEGDTYGAASGAGLPRVLARAAGVVRRESRMLDQVLGARNITLPGGTIEVGDKKLTVDPSGEFKSEREIGDVLLSTPNGRRYTSGIL